MVKKINNKIVLSTNSFVKYKLYFFWIATALIFTLAIFFRFYNTPARYGFDPDPVRDSFITTYAVESAKLPLAGPVSGIAPFTFGPWYYYFLIIFKLILPIDYSPWILIGLFSLGFVFTMYKIGEVLEGRYFGLLLAFLAAITPAQTGPSAGLSNPNFVPLHAALTLLLGIIYFKNTKTWFFLIMWGLIYGIGVNHHFQMIGLLLFPCIIILLKREKVFQNLLLFIAGSAISFIPLLIFNITNNWHTVRGVIFYILDGRHATYIPNSWTLYIKEFFIPFWSNFYGVTDIIGIAFLSILTLVFLYLFWKRKIKGIYIILLTVFLLHFLVLRYVISHRDYYYYLFLHPFIFIFSGFGIWTFTTSKIGKVGAVGILLLILYFSTPVNLERLKSQPQQADYIRASMQISKKLPNEMLSLYTCDKNDRHVNLSRGIALFLYNKEILSENGTRLGIISGLCKTNKMNKSTIKESQNLIHFHDLETLKGLEILDLTKKSKTQLVNEGWIPITPQSVYKDSFSLE